MDKFNIPISDISEIPIPQTGPDGITGATQDKIKHVNYNLFRVLSTKGAPGAAFVGFRQPCVHWFGEDYPISALYEQPAVNVSSVFQLRDRYI